jgi:hypothetical protein
MIIPITQTSVAVIKNATIPSGSKVIDVQPPSSELKPQTFSFKGMRHSLHIVLCALNYYFCGNSTTRKVSHILHMVHQIKVSHVYYLKMDQALCSCIQENC